MSKHAVTPIVINYKLNYRMSEQPPLDSSTTTTKLSQQDGSAWDGYTAPLDQHTAKIYGNTIDQYDTAPDYALDLPNNLLHLRYVFDTGATHVLSSTSVHEALKTAHPSRLEITGYHGTQTQFGKLAGTLSGCPVGSTMTTPFTFGTDTLDGLNDPLFSFTEMYEQRGFSLCLAQPGNWSGLYRTDAVSGQQIDKIPLTYCWNTHQWILEIIIGQQQQASRFAKLVYERRKCNTKLARELNRAYSIPRDDIELVSAITSALAMPAANHSQDSEKHTWVGSSPDPDDCNTHALKTGRFKSMTHKQLHETLGHFGYLPGCVICMQVKKNLNRIYKNPRPKGDVRPGYTWDLDVIYWSFTGVSKRGYRYSIILRDRCTGTPLITHMATRDETTTAMVNLITDMRNDKRFKQPYPMFSCLNLDLAGEFTGGEFKEAMQSLGIREINWRDPQRKEDNGVAEFAVQKIEIATKRSMATTSTPVQYFCYHADHCVKVMARLPLTRNISTADCDAIRPLEQLYACNGQTGISRAQCDKDLLAMNVPGSLVLCTDKDSKGSDLDRIDRCSWGIVLGTKGTNQVDMGHLSLIENPFTRAHRHTKSLTVLQMAAGQSAWSTLGLPTPLLPKTSVIRSGDQSFPTVNIIKLPYHLDPIQPNPVILGFKMHDQDFHDDPVLKMYDNSGRRLTTDPHTGELQTGQLALPDILEQLDITKQPDMDSDTTEHAADVLTTRPKDFIGRSVYQYFADASPPGQYAGRVVSYQLDKDLGHLWQIFYPELGDNLASSCEYDEQDMITYCVHGDKTDLITAETIDSVQETHEDQYLCLDDFDLYFTKDNDNFRQICDQICIPGPDRLLYYTWLEKHFGYGPSVSTHPDQLTFRKPFNDANKLLAGDKFRAQTRFPKPSGSSWIHVKQNQDTASNLQNEEHLLATTARIQFAKLHEQVRLEAKETNHLPQVGGCDALQPETGDEDSISEGELRTITEISDLCNLDTAAILTEYATAAAALDAVNALAALMETYVPNSPYADPATGQIVPPKSYADAQSRSDWLLWKYAIDKELKSFEKLKVHSEKMSLDTVRDKGYKQRPVRSHFIFDSKYDICTGAFLKPKARWVVQGDPNQMKKGIHYFQSYSPAPSTTTTRMMQSIACGYDKKRHAADVETAFLHSDLESHEQIPIRLPDGMETTDQSGSVRRYVILYKGQYGTPSAGFYWTRTRDAWLMTEFMKPPWHIKQMTLEPCMFVITNTERKTVSHHLIHVDDIDTIADTNEDVEHIYGQLHQRFGLTRCKPEVMLGVERRMTTVDGTRYMEFLMPTYITNMHAEWSAKWTELKRPWSTTVPEIPIPANTILSVAGTEKYPRPSDAEIAETTELHMHLTGQLLWLSRMCMPEILFACSQMSRVLSASSWDALELGMQIIRYAYGQRHRGLRFRSDGHPKLRASYDASDNPDPKDGKSSYGYSICLFDGPLHAVSKKTARVGTSSTHNEYIAQAEMAKCLVFIQNLFIEMGFPEICDEPTPAAGDNYTATTQLQEQRLTERNRFYVTDYFYCVEIFQDGKFIPYWVRTNDNGADIYTKAVPPQIMKRLRPGQTGYSDGPLPAVDLTITPKTTQKGIPTVSTAIATHVFDWEGVKRT